MKKIKAYTLVEILIVVIIVGILAWLTRNIFNDTRQNKIILGENCSNYIYGKLSNFASSINYGKTISGQNNTISYYKITYSGNKIELGTVSWTTYSVQDTIYIGTGLSSNRYEWCKSSSYSLATTGTIGMDTIALPVKGQILSWNNNTSRHIWTWNLTNTLNTGSIELFVCDKNIISTNHSSCIASSKILIDRRSKQIFLQKCLSRNSTTGKCTSRPTGF